MWKSVLKGTPFLFSVTSVLSAGAGAAVAGIVVARRAEKKYVAIAEKEIADAKEFYKKTYKVDEYSDPVEIAAGYEDVQIQTDEDEELKQAVEAFNTYRGHPALQDTEAVNVFDTHAVPVGEENPEGLTHGGKPYVIAHNEFHENAPEFEQSELTYFEQSDTLADSRDEVIVDVEELVGEENLTKFGQNSGDNNIVYVRNEKLEMDFCIVKSGGDFAREVHGFIQHSDEPKIRKFRMGRDE